MLITGRSPPQVCKYSALKPSNENSNTGDLVNLNKQKVNVRRQTLRNSFLSLISSKFPPDSGNVDYGAMSHAKKSSSAGNFGGTVVSKPAVWSLCSRAGRAIHTQRLRFAVGRAQKSHDKGWFQTQLQDEEQAKMLRWSIWWVWHSLSWNQSHWSNTQPLQPHSLTPS